MRLRRASTARSPCACEAKQLIPVSGTGQLNKDQHFQNFGDKPRYEKSVSWPTKAPFNSHMTTFRREKKTGEEDKLVFYEAMVRRGVGEYVVGLDLDAYLAQMLRDQDFVKKVLTTATQSQFKNLNVGRFDFR